MSQTIQVKRGLKVNLPILLSGEIGFCTDTKEVFIGDGTTNMQINGELDGATVVSLINGSASLIDDNNLSVNVADAITKKHSHSNTSILDATTASFLIADKTKLNGIETGAEVNNISDLNVTDLTDAGDTSLHYHSTDRNRANHTGTQLASTISDFASTVRSTVLTGLSTATNAVITATDTVLSALGKLQKQITDNLSTLTSHTSSILNPHSVNKTQVGLGSVDNTSDANKPVSTAQQTALNGKVDDAQVLTNVPVGALFTDTITTINGKIGAIAKLDIVALGIPAQDTVYTLPTTLPATMITESVDHSFLLDAERTKLSGVAVNANNYVHPVNHPPSIITQDSSNRFVTDADHALWDAKAPLASPALTGTPTAPTPTTADNDTSIATTAFVKAQGYITIAGSGAKIAVDTVAPTTPSTGDFWYQVL